MCRGKNHGNRRCPHDTSEARKQRRRAAQGRELYKKPILTDYDNKVIPEDTAPRTFAELKKEVKLIKALLHAPVHKDPAIQAEIDAKNELLVTRLGIELANEAEKRAKLNYRKFERDYEKMSKEFLAVSEEIRPLREEESEARLALREAEGKSWPKNPDFVPDDDEVARLQKIHAEVETRYLEVQKRWDEQDRLDNERRKNLSRKLMKRLSAEYRSIIAEIRPVGGELKVDTSLSSEDGLKTFQQTVYKDYPTDWIEASNNAGPIAIITDDSRPNYNKMKSFEGEEGKNLNPEITYASMVAEEETIRERVRLLSEDGDTVKIEGSPFTLQGNKQGSLLLVRMPHRVTFNAAKDKADAQGKPTGEGWKYGHVLNDSFEVDGRKQWYRNVSTGAGIIPAITIGHSSHPEAKTYAYHEAVHRFEDTVGNGVITRAETAFLKRRASVDGKQKALIGIAPSNDVLGGEVAAEGGFMNHYIGRVYPDQQAKEILSVGSEAMFCEKYGAFIRLDRSSREDRDHRGFVLGMFATA